MKEDHFTEFHLSTEGYYFKYRMDIYNSNVTRASLYNRKGQCVDDVRVSDGFGQPEKNHTDVINYFEARIQLGKIAQQKIAQT